MIRRRSKTGEGSVAFQAEFVGLFNRRWESVFRYLNRMMDDPDAASDLAQQAFLRLWKRGRMPDDPAAWVLTVANNLRRDRERKRVRQLRIVKRADPVDLRAGSAAPLPDEDLWRRDTRVAVRSALNTLSASHREVLMLRAEGYRYREIASITGMNMASVGQTLARAKVALQKALGEVGIASDR